MPPGSVRNAFAWASIRPLRSRIVSTTSSSSESVSPTSRSTSARGMTPMVRPPSARTARAISPIIETLPPPETKVQPRLAIFRPTSAARSR
jgi:hypothetical protein